VTTGQRGQGGQRGQTSRLGLAALGAVLAAGTVGFATGVSRQAPPQGYLPEGNGDEQAGDGAVRRAPTQAELAAAPFGPNRARLAKNLEELASERRGLTDEVGRPSDEAWDEAVAARTKNRAFNGAPPVVPHAIEPQGFPSCLTCHLEGVVIEGRTAPMMSHERMDNCTQCHVSAERPVPGEVAAGGPFVANGFRGVDRAGRGERASPGAPPTIPHSTFMRERCESCHGVLATGLRTSHACRQSCQQCHAPAAGLDQMPETGPPPMPVASIGAGSR